MSQKLGTPSVQREVAKLCEIQLYTAQKTSSDKYGSGRTILWSSYYLYLFLRKTEAILAAILFFGFQPDLQKSC